MKTTTLTIILASAVLSLLGAGRSLAVNPTETVFNGQVANSTYTFTNIGVAGTTATLDQTTIPNLNSLVPAVTLQLVLNSLSYTDTQDTFVGTGADPSITFDLTPTLQMAHGGNLPSTQVTLFASAIPSGQTESDVVFTLQSPVVFAPVAEDNPGNLDEGSGTFTEGLSNLEPNPDSISLSGATLQSGQPIQVNNQDFSLSGTVEIFYEAVPEPRSGALAIMAGLGFVVLIVRRSFARMA
jgi:hypothetical protein